MLGDAGANVLGAAVGTAAARSTAPPARLGMLALVVALNLASETVSFSTVIERTPVLRALDRLGRRPLPAPRPGPTPAGPRRAPPPPAPRAAAPPPGPPAARPARPWGSPCPPV